MVVVIFSPGCGEFPCRYKALEYFGGQELVSQPAVEALGVPILPRAAWLDVQGFNRQLLRPLLNRSGDELGTIVAANVFWHAPHGEQLCERVDHVFTRDAAGHLQRQALPRKLIDDRQPLERRAALGPIEHEVPAPDVIFVFSLPSMAAVLAAAQTSTFSLLLWHFQSFPTP